MSYLFSIKTSILFFPFLALLFTLPFILHQYRKYGSLSILRAFIIYSFILYMITVYFLVILPLPDKEDVVYSPEMIRLIPFGFIGDIVRESSFVWNDVTTYLKALKEPVIYTVLFNILMTVPFGMYLRYYFKCNLKKTIFYSFLLSLFFEVTQLSGLYGIYPYPYRVFDVDDLLVNTLGGVIGYSLISFRPKFLPTREAIDERAIERGRVVSGLRRIFIFGIDFFLYLLFTIFLSLFYPKFSVFYFSFFLYYLLIPIVLSGTLGSLFLKVKFEFQDKKILCMTARNVFVFLYYLVFPIIIPYFLFLCMNYFSFGVFVNLILVLFILLNIFLFYLIHIIILLKYKRMFYDDILKVDYKSLIDIQNEK